MLIRHQLENAGLVIIGKTNLTVRISYGERLGVAESGIGTVWTQVGHRTRRYDHL